jgi:hypothetical protein
MVTVTCPCGAKLIVDAETEGVLESLTKSDAFHREHYPHLVASKGPPAAGPRA